MPRTLLPPSMEDNECPITQVPKSMLDIPVINKVDGMHYEYAPICLWVETHGTSPVTREKTQVSDLVAENDLWFVLDTSGSMSQPATSLHISETTNLSINDLAVYSAIGLLKAALHLQPKRWTFGAILYDHKVRHVFQRQLLTKASIKSFEECLALHAKPDGMTNWTQPLKAVLREVTMQKTHVIFLTDGVPNQDIEGIEQALHAVRPSNNMSFHALAFGYAGIDMLKLKSITDAVKQRQCVQWHAHVPGGVYFIASVTDIIDAVMTLATSILVGGSTLRADCRASRSDVDEQVTMLKEVLATASPVVSRFTSTSFSPDAVEKARAIASQYPTYEADLIHALSGVTEYAKWGHSWLSALLDAHESMQMRNKYDKTCACYADLHDNWSSTMASVRAVFDSILVPAPLHNRAPPCGQAARNVPVNRSLSQVYDGAGACISGDTMIMTPEGNKPASTVAVGDEVYSAGMPCVVDMVMITSGSFKMLNIDGARLTEYHPFKLPDEDWQFPSTRFSHGTDEEWQFTCSHQSQEEAVDQLVYNFVLTDQQVRQPGIDAVTDAGTVLVATLGHGLTGDVIGHPFYGTNKVIEDLQDCSYNRVANLTSEWFIRDETGKVCAIKRPKRDTCNVF